MKRKTFHYDSRSGQNRIYAVRWIPDGEAIGIIQIIHGMNEYIERYEEFATFLTRKGFIVTGEDHLGHGKSVGEEGIYGYFCEEDPATVVVEDVHRLRRYTQKEYKDLPYFMIGHSMGSYILRNYMEMYAEGLAGVVLMGTGSMSTTMLVANKLATGIGTLLFGSKKTANFINKIAFRYYNKRINNPRTYMDWLCKDQDVVNSFFEGEMRNFIFTINGFRALGTFVWRAQDKKRIAKYPKELPIFMISGKEDPVGSYGAAVIQVCEMYKDMGISNVTLKLYEDDRHELVQETDKEIVFEDILGWISNL